MAEQTKERERLLSYHNRESNWKEWGPYVSERAWGTVREDYSANGDAWSFFPHDHAKAKAYRWNEDGIAGISDRHQYLCFAVGLWNGKDPILKERMFGLGSHEGNHGEDVKEYYFYLDNTPAHSYQKMLYKYPQNEFPYEMLLKENKKRGFFDPEFELLDTKIFDNDEYFDVFIEYAKASETDILVKISLHNRSNKEANCTVLPTLWFRNTWSWGYPQGPMGDVPTMPKLYEKEAGVIAAEHPVLGNYFLYSEKKSTSIFTENNTNTMHLYNVQNKTPYVKDAFHRYVIHKEMSAVNPKKEGTKAAFVESVSVPAHGSLELNFRLSNQKVAPFQNFEPLFLESKKIADEFYEGLFQKNMNENEKLVLRQAFASLLWTKQLYYFDVDQWLNGDPHGPKPPESRKKIRNFGWEHLVNFDVISMPDKWEYPWYASWDLCFHALALAFVDSDFAKRQITLMTREWYMHPNGQLPAYEWNFSDVNPPVLAWAALRTYQIDADCSGKKDRAFIEGIFHKLLLNFTWWINQKDAEGRNVFQGGFLGLDNISVFDRSKPLPTGGHIDQSDATAWMAFYCVMMMKISLELAQDEPVYQDTASKFFEHFQRISGAMADYRKEGRGLWNEEDGFFYDVLRLPDGSTKPLKVRSIVGLLPLLSIETLEPEIFKKAPVFERRLEWFTSRFPQLSCNMACTHTPGTGKKRQMAILTKDRIIRVLHYLFDSNEFLSDFGIRSLSKFHKDHPYTFSAGGMDYSINYEPAESESGLFGGNSNWRGPIWMPINVLIVGALERIYSYYGDTLQVDFPTGSNNKMNLKDIANELSKRICSIYFSSDQGKRPVHGQYEKFQTDPHWKDYLLFHEYFHGDTGAGLGASHQTGWTSTLINLLLR